ncbi:hypothetical protein TNCV_1580091 [Trichonephila clavipes]|nr:hypothetical protein TNCV_1580091 [Trichonephila clavipes]
MTTTSYRIHAAVGVRHLFSVEALLCCPVASWCTRNDDNDILPPTRGGGCSSFFSVEALLCCPVSLGARGTMTTTSYRSRSAVGVRQFFPSRHYSAVRSRLGARGTMTTTSYRIRAAVGVRHRFSVEALLCCPVASWCTRNDDNDILPQPLGGGCSSLFPSKRHYFAVRSRLGARGTMTTTSYASRAAVGVRHRFSVEALLCCPVASWCTRNDDNDILPRRAAVGVRHFFSVEALLCCPVASWCTRNDDNDILPQPRGGGCSSNYFSVEALLCCPVASWCTRNDDNDILPQPRGGGCSSIFPSRHYSAVRSRLGARGTMTTTSYRSRSAVGVRHFFPSRHYSAVRSRLGARGTMTMYILRIKIRRWVFVTFFRQALLCCPVTSWCTRNDDNDILPQPLGGGCSSFFPSRHYSAVRSRLGARGTMTTTSYRSRSAVGVRHPKFFRRGTTLLSGQVLCMRNDDNDILPQPLGGGCSSIFSVEALLCCPVASWCTRNDDNDILPQPLGGGCSSPFSVEALLCCPVASWCTRNDDNDILPQPLGGGCSSFFPSRHYSAVRSRLGARGTMTTTSYRSRSAVGVRHLFPSRHYSAVRSRLGARGTMTTTSYRIRSAVGVRHCCCPVASFRNDQRRVFVTFSVEALLCCPVASWCTRNDDNDILPQPFGGGCSSLFFKEALCCPVASWCTRNDDNDILPRPLGGGCSSPFFRRGTTLLSGRVFVHAER